MPNAAGDSVAPAPHESSTSVIVLGDMSPAT